MSYFFNAFNPSIHSPNPEPTCPSLHSHVKSVSVNQSIQPDNLRNYQVSHRLARQSTAMARKTEVVTCWCQLLIVATLVQLMCAAPLDNPDEEYVYTTLNGPDSHIGIQRVDIISGQRDQRGVKNETKPWSHHIPYVLDPTYLVHGKRAVYTLKRAIQRIMDKVCVTYTDVTDRWNKTNTHWFTDNGFQSNSYILFLVGTSGCAALSGIGNGKSARTIYPCFDFGLNTHEVMHTLGVTHTQEVPSRNNYLTVNFDNINPTYYFTYTAAEPKGFLDSGFDPQSVMMYHHLSFSRNGLQTYTPIRDDIFEGGYYQSSDAAVFQELNLRLRCNELYCGNSQKDCGPGYHTLIKGVCRCVCPAELNPETDCKTLINGFSGSAHWPDTPMVVFTAGADNRCPTGFDSQVGWYTFDGKWAILQKPLPVLFPKNDKTIYISTCTKNTPQNLSEINWESWPDGGTFCFIKPVDVDCAGDFEQFTISYQSLARVYHSGGIGDTTISGNQTVLRICCKDTGPALLPIELPNKVPFRLLAKGSCPRVKGMRDYEAMVDLYTNVVSMSGSIPPSYSIFANELQIHICYYQPPVYGCNQNVVLSKEKKSVTISTPGFGLARQPDRRCLYNFTVPANTQVKVTFNTYDPHESDLFLVKRYHRWQEPASIPSDNWPQQFLTEKDYLFMEYWASWQDTTKQGISFTADLILPEDLCYNATTKGDDYAGNTWISETYEECLPWSEAVQCSDFPTDGMTPIWLLLSENKCRNPGGKLIQPWCYIHRNGSNCHKRFCDVCNIMTPFDVLKNCSILKSTIPDFCKIAIERYSCFKTCGFTQEPVSRATCGPPQKPEHGEFLEPTKSSYLEGEKVFVKCTNGNHVGSQKEIMCTHSGWTQLNSICPDSGCEDAISTPTCERLLTAYPSFCNGTRFTGIVNNCQLSCGRCSTGTETIKCIGNSSSSVMITSAGHVNPGQVMNFTCRPGFFLASGRLERACSATGQLLGDAPVCAGHPGARDVQRNAVIRRHTTLSKGMPLLFTDSSYRVPFDGKIDRWYYYCDKPGQIYFLVYRPGQSSSEFQYVGSNGVVCQSYHVRGHYVPIAEQISVQQDDVVGVYATMYTTISMNNCTASAERVARVVYGSASTVQALKQASFPYESCIVASVGYHIIPN